MGPRRRQTSAPPALTEEQELSHCVRATNKYVAVANQFLSVGERSNAREAFRRAKRFAQVDPALLEEIDAAIETLGG